MVADEDTDFLRRGTLLDRYEIRELIGVGGMGRVYRARDTTLDRDVVIKTLADKSEEFIRRFMREASVMAKLNHQNVVQILDFRVSENGQPFIVMPFLRGCDLAERLKARPMEIGDAVDLVLGVCAGVFACHRRGIIHRDLKPRNVFLAETVDYGTVVKVLDFGVARLAQTAEGDELTNAGTMIGTPKYMAPEQVKREDADERTDQYGIGLLLYCASTRRMPFRKLEGIDLVRAILKGDYPPPQEHRPEIPDELAQVIGRAMQVAREERFASVHELGRVLLPWATPEGKSLWTVHFTTALRPMVPEASAAFIRERSRGESAEAETAKAKTMFAAIPEVALLPELESAIPNAPVVDTDAGTTLIEAGDDEVGPAPALPQFEGPCAQPEGEADGGNPVDYVLRPTLAAGESAVDSGGHISKTLSSDREAMGPRRRRWLVSIAAAGALMMGVGGGSLFFARGGMPARSGGAPQEGHASTDCSARRDGVDALGIVDGGPDGKSGVQERGAEHPKPAEPASEGDVAIHPGRKAKAGNLPPKESKRKPMPRKSTVRYTPDGWPILD